MKWIAAVLATLMVSLTACAPPSTAPAPQQEPAAAAPSAQPAAQPAAQAPKPAAPPAKPYYEGKTITFLIPFGAGGGTDVRARHVAQHVGKFIPGNPQVLVENKPGGGGAIAFNHVAQRAKADGLTFGIGSAGIPVRWVTAAKGHEYDLKKMKLVAAIGAATVPYISAKTGVKSLKDLVNLGRPIKTAHTTPDSSFAVTERLLADLLGVQFQQISGYKGYAETKLAVLRGEADLSWAETDGYVADIKNYVKSGDVVTLMQSGLLSQGKTVRDSRMADIPLLQEAYKEAFGKSVEESKVWPGLNALVAVQTFGVSFWLHEDTPPEVYAELVKAFTAMSKSQEYRDASVKVYGLEDLVFVGDDARGAFNVFAGMPDDVKKLMTP